MYVAKLLNFGVYRNKQTNKNPANMGSDPCQPSLIWNVPDSSREKWHTRVATKFYGGQIQVVFLWLCVYKCVCLPTHPLCTTDSVPWDKSYAQRIMGKKTNRNASLPMLRIQDENKDISWSTTNYIVSAEKTVNRKVNNFLLNPRGEISDHRDKSSWSINGHVFFWTQ